MAGEVSSSIAGSQIRTFLSLWAAVAPELATNRALPDKLDQLLTRNRAFGSRDRRLYRELTYTCLRYHAWLGTALAKGAPDAIRALAWLSADIPATCSMKRHACDDWPATPATIGEKRALLRDRTIGLSLDAALLPSWLQAECPEAFCTPLIDTLHTRSPMWIRLQTDLHDGLFAEFQERGWSVIPSRLLSDAWRLVAVEKDVTASAGFRAGQFEIQDLGSQLLVAAPPLHRGEHWYDACAGAGGKTLALARRLGPDGRVTAWDTRASALAELRIRATRAGLKNIRIASPAAGEHFDGVFVDAPCSGSGTWRRAPHLKHSTHASTVAQAAHLQLQLLDTLAAHVRPGGVLVYATCSICRTENQGVRHAFLAGHPRFEPGELVDTFGYRDNPTAGELILDPSVHDTDGFYLACFRRGEE